MKRTPATLRKLLDSLVIDPKISHAAKAVGITSASFFGWVKASSEGDELFLVEWQGETKGFHEQVSRARALYALSLDHTLRSEVLNGIPKTVVHDGKVQYQPHPVLQFWSDKDLEAFGYGPSDRFLKDEHGAPIPLTVMETAPAHLKIAAAQKYLGWRDAKTVDMRVHGETTVTVRHPNRQDAELPLVRELRARLLDLQMNGPAHPHPEPAPAGAESAVSASRRGSAPADGGTRPAVPGAPLALPAPPRGRAALDDRAEGIGAGQPRPGGYQVVGSGSGRSGPAGYGGSGRIGGV